MRQELMKKVLLDKIFSKIKDKNKPQEIDIYIKEMTNEIGICLFDLEEMGDLLYEIGEDTEGQISMLQPLPIETGTPYSEEARAMGITGDFYFKIRFDPKAFKAKSEDKSVQQITLSKNEGLCRHLQNGETKCYPVEGKRFLILSALSNQFQLTRDLAKDSEYEDDEDKFRAQIGHIRKQIESKLLITGSDFIEGDQRKGYRYGKSFKVRKT